MKIIADFTCPICKKKTECTSFHIKAAHYTLLNFYCRVCNLTFDAKAKKYKFDKGSIEFIGVLPANEMHWSGKRDKFNPTDRYTR